MTAATHTCRRVGERVCVCVLHGGRGQVGVFVFELPVQRQASLLAVLVERRGQGVNLAEGGAGRHLVTDTTTRRRQSQCSAKPRPQPTRHNIRVDRRNRYSSPSRRV